MAGTVSSMVVSTPGAQIEYLGVSQDNYDASMACATVSLFVAQYLCYSKEPRRRELMQHFEAGAREWCAARHAHHGRCQSTDAAHQQYVYTALLLTPVPELCVQGYSTFPARRLAPELSSLDGVHVCNSVAAALEVVAERVRRMHLFNALAFTFTRAMRTLGGVMRSQGNGRDVEIDFVDPHCVVVRSALPPETLERGSAVWVRARSVASAAAVIEAIYPPLEVDSDAPDAVNQGLVHDMVAMFGETLGLRVAYGADVPTVDRRGQALTPAERQRIGERRLTSGADFTLTVFKPTCATPREAAQTAAAAYEAATGDGL